jgi:hypothetical protein
MYFTGERTGTGAGNPYKRNKLRHSKAAEWHFYKNKSE